MTGARDLAVVANTRLPSQRAQALQVVQSAAAFSRAGCDATILYADRRAAIELPRGQDVFDYYGVPAGPRPALEPVPCLDWIDAVPRQLQYLPSRAQELTFARNATRRILDRHRDALVIAREIECGRGLARRGFERLVLEIHRVPGGKLRRRWLLDAARGALGVIAISGGVRDDLLRLGVDAAKVRVEHDAIEPARFAALPSRAVARAELGLDANARIAVYTGGLLEWKGVDVLVDAARLLPDVQVVIAGGMDRDVERLRAHASGLAQVRIDGFQPPSRVALYLAAADVGVVPNRAQPAISARYTSPLKVFEAFATGLPLVASDLPSLRELLTDGLDGVLVAPDDAAALARGISRLIQDEPLLRSASVRVLQRSREHTWDARAHRILAWTAAACRS